MLNCLDQLSSLSDAVKDDELMPQRNLTSSDTPQYLHPIQILERLSETLDNGCLHLSNDSIDWLFYFKQGKLIYASHSIDPVDRLERHLRRLNHQLKTLTREVCYQVRSYIENNLSTNITEFFDYQAINWLVENKFLPLDIAGVLAKQMTQEVLELYIVLPMVVQKDWLILPLDLPIFCELDLPSFLKYCNHRIKIWQSLAPEILSPCQRPYFFLNSYAQQKLSEDQQQKLGKLLKGYSIYHLAAILRQDELTLAQKLYPLVKHKAILVREAQPPYDKLPKFYHETLPDTVDEDSEEISSGEDPSITLNSIGTSSIPNRVWRIVCIDDSQTMLNEINRFLDAENFFVYLIQDSLKALMQVIRIKPDLILLDASMPNVDGYKLCSLLRKNNEFKEVPIIMVTAKTGLIDRARAKMAGTTDYMTKPFTQEELLKMVFRYLT